MAQHFSLYIYLWSGNFTTRQQPRKQQPTGKETINVKTVGQRQNEPSFFKKGKKRQRMNEIQFRVNLFFSPFLLARYDTLRVGMFEPSSWPT
jgi:hypothetical protein